MKLFFFIISPKSSQKIFFMYLFIAFYDFIVVDQKIDINSFIYFCIHSKVWVLTVNVASTQSRGLML